jgi:hypothetical protein
MIIRTLMTLILQIIADRKNLRKSFQSAPCLGLRRDYLRSIYAITRQTTLSRPASEIQVNHDCFRFTP